MLDGTSTPTESVAPELPLLAGSPAVRAPGFLISVADDGLRREAYLRLRHSEFVNRQGLFAWTDRDEIDDDPRTVVLVATDGTGTVFGGVRVAPCTTPEIGWWSGGRLVTAAGAARGVGAALIRAACAYVEGRGALRFDATVQDRYVPLFTSNGWTDIGAASTIRGRRHRRMTWPIGRIQALADGTKAVLAEALAPFATAPGGLGPAGFRGDDGVPVPGTDVIAACDAILPSMVERDPEWAGWCSVLVNLNDVSSMGAQPLGLLDAVGASTRSQLTRIVRGISNAASAWRVPVLGGHTQVGVPAALAVTALGQTSAPVPASGGEVGHTVSLVADLGGSWRPGYRGHQWDSSSSRTSDDLVRLSSIVRDLGPAAAKDVSMTGIVGTLGMLAEASGTGAELDVAAVPRPEGVEMGSWLTCFPGYAMIVADQAPLTEAPGPAVASGCGRLTSAPGVRLRWPDGQTTIAIRSTVTGLGRG